LVVILACEKDGPWDSRQRCAVRVLEDLRGIQSRRASNWAPRDIDVFFNVAALNVCHSSWTDVRFVFLLNLRECDETAWLPCDAVDTFFLM
jgi:hypothetical protein